MVLKKVWMSGHHFFDFSDEVEKKYRHICLLVFKGLSIESIHLDGGVLFGHEGSQLAPPANFFVSRGIVTKIKNRFKGYMKLIGWTSISHNSLSSLREVCLKRHSNWKTVSKIMQISAKITNFSIPFFWNCPISKRISSITSRPRFVLILGGWTVWMLVVMIFKSIWTCRAPFLVYGELFRAQ